MNTTLPQSGEVFDFRYRIACRLGRGADGYVFGATELETGKRVAIKCWVGPHAEHALSAAQQFVRAAHEARLFDNPHIVELHAAEAGRTVNYCVMDWLEGMTLAQRIVRRRPSPLHDVFNIVVPVMRAVAEAHAAGIIHGDLRPGHIFVCQATRHRPTIARVFDFGRGFSGLPSMPHVARAASEEALQYASPEQLIGAALDARTDTYAFGVMLFEMLAGERAFNADSSDELARKIKDGATKLLASISPAIPVRLAHVVERAMAVDPQLRYASLVELIEALEPFEPVGAQGASVSRPSIPSLPKSTASALRGSLPPTPRTPRPSAAAAAGPHAQTIRTGRVRKTPPPPPPPRKTVVSAPPPPPPPAAHHLPEEITTTSASWELTEPIRMRGYQIERLLRMFGGLRQKRAAVWCLVLMASMIAARAVQRMAAPVFAPESSDAPQRQHGAPSLLDLDPPECYSVVGATDPRCAHAPHVPQPSAAPIRPSETWPATTWLKDAGSTGAAATDAADSGMRSQPPAGPARTGQRTERPRRAKSLPREDKRHGALDDLLETADEAEGEHVAPPARKRSVTSKSETRSGRRSRTGDGGSKATDPFERLDRMRLQ